MTPGRVRAGFRGARQAAGTPASAAKTTRPGPGRPQGSKNKHRPYEYSEHPVASPDYGAHYVRTVLEALMGNRALWETTALFITYDEHHGYFDHMLPGSPEATVTNEFIGGLPVGFGPRVPMIICSPWTRGGYVDSNRYDHTSMLRFLEAWPRRRPAGRGRR